MQCGLLGGKLGHSYSPLIHSFLGDYQYNLYEKTTEEIEDFLKNSNFTGINVTIPHKQAVIPYCDSLTPVAAKIGAVNTIIRQKDGKLIGHNTDYFGFETMLSASGLQLAGKKVLVLGTGGASRVVQTVLEEQGAKVVVISRTGENNYDNLHLHEDAAAIVNTTPVGMYPNTDDAPLSLEEFPNLEGVLDAIYNPARTKLLLEAEERGLVAENGLLMLVSQAKEAAEWFTGEKIDDQKIHEIYSVLQNQMLNIVLIGMPGCGKSTVGKILADKTGKTFVDADTMIEEKAGCSIPQIFSNGGESAFRQLETQVLAEVGKKSGLVIATGGGCVTREENYPALHQNGRIFLIERELTTLARDGRPLSAGADLTEMYRIRKPMYDRFADYQVENRDPREAAAEILKLWEENV